MLDNRKEVLEKVSGLRAASAAPLRILDVGGGYYPFAQATHVADMVTYDDFMKLFETRAYSASGIWGGEKPAFSRESWTVHDICSEDPLPFPDKYFDFCVCTHLLEDLANPFRAASEISRVSKAGYVEVPSKELECTLGVDGLMGRGYPGYNHHFWLFSQENGRLAAEPKYSFIASDRSFHFPDRMKKRWERLNGGVTKLFWEGSIGLSIRPNPLAEDLRLRQLDYIRSKSGFAPPMLKYLVYALAKKLRNRIRGRA